MHRGNLARRGKPRPTRIAILAARLRPAGMNALAVAFGESSTIGSSGHLRFLFKTIVGIASVSSSAVTNKGNEAN
jgi:hypothetical protein